MDQEKREKRKQYMREYYSKHPEKFKLTPEQRKRRNKLRKDAYATNPQQRARKLAEVKRWQQKNPEKRKTQRLRKYNLSHAEFLAMLASQGGKCAVCGYSDTSIPKFFPVVDHCHKTGRVRGLLCMNCNQGLGKFMDSTERLKTAAEYLSSRGSSGVT